MVLKGEGRMESFGTTMLVSAFVLPTLLAALKIAVGIALIRFGKRYEQEKKERR